MTRKPERVLGFHLFGGLGFVISRIRTLSCTATSDSLLSMRLTPTERLILINQYEILNKLEPGSHYEDTIRVLRSVFELEINGLFDGIDPDGLSRDDCAEVIDILAMFDHLIVSFEKMEDKEGLTEGDVKFRGFDSQTETKQWLYALHLVEDQKRFRTKATDLKGYDPMLSKYRQMLPSWETAKASRSGPDVWLLPHDIRAIIEPLSRRG